MSYCAISPFVPVTQNLRRSFARLALATEPNGTRIWTITGAEQTPLRKNGTLHTEGRYLLRQVVKRWERGYLCAGSFSAEEDDKEQVWVCRTPEGVMFSSSLDALKRVFPDAAILPWEGRK